MILNLDRLLIFLLIILISSCRNKEIKREPIEIDNEVSVIIKKENELIDSLQSNKIDYDNNFTLDISSLELFWKDFQDNIKKEKRKEIIGVLEFPIHAIYPVLFQYAYDCDTLTYISNEEKYFDFDIDANNIDEYFDFVFSKTLKEIISQISYKDLLNEKNIDKKSSGIILQIFPKNYNVKINCTNDHLLMLYLTQKGKDWKIGIGGL